MSTSFEAAAGATATTMAQPIGSTDERLPLARLVPLGLQHVLVMYAGAIAVPLIIGRALKLPPEQVALLINADLFCCGLVTIIQSLGVTGWFGIRLPVMMGVTFAAVGPMVAIGTNPGLGITGIFGAVIGAGIVSMLIAPFVSRMLPLFPPVVTGTVIAVIGISLMRVAIQWAVGGAAIQPRIPDPAAAGAAAPPLIPNPAYASPEHLGIALFVLIAILLIAKYGKGFLSNIAVLLGIVLGCVVASLLGQMSFAKVAQAKLFALVTPFQFGMPTFDVVAIVTMTLVMIVVMIESTGMFLALGEMTERKISQKDLARGLRTDGLGTLIGGIFNTFPYTSFSQNVGLVAVTGIKSRYVCVAGGVILIVLGLLPKMATLVESLPTVVLGGAGLVMFGMVAATGIRILSGVDFRNNRHNAMIVAVSLGIGMIPLIAPNFKQWMPHAIHSLIESGILLASIAAVLLNLFLNGAKHDESAVIAAAKQAEAH